MKNKQQIYTSVKIQEFGLEKTYTFLKNDAIGNDVINKGTWEPHITEFLVKTLKSVDNCLDIGANFGYHTINMSMLAYKGQTFAFEPMRLFSQQIAANSCLNQLTNITIFNNAVGNESKHVTVSEPDLKGDLVNHGDMSIKEINDTNISVKTIKIDDINLPKVDFMKIDVQGYELQVLKGATTTILKHKPVIIVEVEPHQLAKFDCDPTTLISFLKNQFNYNIYQMFNKYPCDFVCSPHQLSDHLNLNFCRLIKIH